MERGNAPPGPRRDDAPSARPSGLPGAGGHRTERGGPEPPADDDPEEHATPLRRPGSGAGHREAPDRLRLPDPEPARSREEETENATAEAEADEAGGPSGPPASGARDGAR
ncbi:hypothetical protein ACFQE5_16625 [Pseudonocardia hispaniensis]|uniref:Uncharacterized protein n=1 Tax=Pseudonocardia hispaniensis TaxID=904933 RepID=A0ABW1J5V6_9PSEU